MITGLLSVCVSGFWEHVYCNCFKFVFFFFSFSLCSPAVKLYIGSGHSEYLKYITQSINPSAPRGITAAQVWCAQTAEVVELCTGNELKTLMLGRTGGYRS